jgi:hypothetical protein
VIRWPEFDRIQVHFGRQGVHDGQFGGAQRIVAASPSA